MSMDGSSRRYYRQADTSIVEAIPMTDREHAQFVALFVPLDLGPVVADTEAVRVSPG